MVEVVVVVVVDDVFAAVVEWEVVVIVVVVAAVDAGVSLTGSLDDSGAAGGFSLSFSSLF